MANSKYEYVKSFEVEDVILPLNYVVVLIDGRDFGRFSDIHEFQKPNDDRALNLMNSCATSVLEEYPDILFSYGFSDEFSFIFKKKTKFYQRRASKILSLVVSFFSSAYVTKWDQFFPEKKLKYPPSFHGRVIQCASVDILQEYLSWRQAECKCSTWKRMNTSIICGCQIPVLAKLLLSCVVLVYSGHVRNQYNTCFWKLVEGGKSEKEAHEMLKGTQKQEKNELLFHQFGINYKELPEMFRQGSCIFKIEVEDIVKYNEAGTLVKRLRRKPLTVHSENIAAVAFWNKHSSLVKDLGSFTRNIGKIEPDHVKSFSFENKLMPFTWIVVRIDGCHFHRFCEVHDFEKPNDKKALDLMNSCATAVLEEFQDVTFSYGVSDEYSFVLKKDSQLYQRLASNIVSVIVSFFCSTYAMRWKAFFPQKVLKYPPSFDGRAICYPSFEIVRDYLTWRQVDCHINNQYNTCFWMLFKSGNTKSEAQIILKGTQSQKKNELLARRFGINYSELPALFRLGSSVFRKDAGTFVNGAGKSLNKVTVEHCNIIDQSFWDKHPYILV